MGEDIQVPSELTFQAQARGIPPQLHARLHSKLLDQDFEAAAAAFRWTADPCRGLQLEALSDLPAAQDIFLVDHTVTFTSPTEVAWNLVEMPSLTQRLAAIMGVDTEDDDDDDQTVKACPDSEATESTEEWSLQKLLEAAGNPPLSQMDVDVVSLNLDNSGLLDKHLSTLETQIPLLFPALQQLSLENNNLFGDQSMLKQSTTSLANLARNLPDLRAIWLRGNAHERNPELSEYTDALISARPSLELIDSKFTSEYTEWAINFALGESDPETWDLTDRGLGDLPVKPEAYTAACSERTQLIYPRQILLTGNALADHPTVLQELGALLSALNPGGIELQLEGSNRAALLSYASGVPQAKLINGWPLWAIVDSKASADDPAPTVDDAEKLRMNFSARGQILGRLSEYTLSYQLAKPDAPSERVDVFYIMDEIGSAVGHDNAERANCRIALVFWRGQALSVLWNTKDLKAGDQLRRDFAENIEEGATRRRTLAVFKISESD